MSELEEQPEPERAGRPSRSLGLLIRQRRNELGWSQEKLAQELNRDWGLRWYQSTVNRVETGGRTVTWDEAVVLAAILDLDLRKASGEARAAKQVIAEYRRHQVIAEAAMEKMRAFESEYGELTDRDWEQIDKGELTLDEVKARNQASKRRKRR